MSDRYVYKGYETPPYEILATDGAIELRRYAPHLVAEVRVEGARRRAISRGFRTLAGYIFGRNATGAKVAMTAPVSALPAGTDDDAWHVRFMMPSDHRPDSLPAPADAAIRLVETATQTEAVIRFSGFWRDRRLDERTGALRAWIAARGLAADGPAHYYFYDDPFTLPFNRRNEVAFPVSGPGC